MNKKRKRYERPSQDQIDLLRQTASSNRAEAAEAMHTLAQALQVPLRSALLEGNILSNIYSPEILEPGATATFPIDFLTADNRNDYIAYVMPREGALPMRAIVGDEITVPTFQVGNAIDWDLKYARTARWDIIARAMETLEAGFVSKMNTDGWETIISAGVGRTDFAGGAPMVVDAGATAGQFTKQLISLMKTTMTRLGGGNSASLTRATLTDVYVSMEAIEDIRAWDGATDGVDDFTLREIFLAGDDTGNGTRTGPLARIYGVNIHPITELGVGQEFQDYFDGLGGVSMGASDEEIVVGLDLSGNDSFVMPVELELQIFEDDNLHRRGRAGFYGWQDHGFGVLDARRVLLGSF